MKAKEIHMNLSHTDANARKMSFRGSDLARKEKAR